MFHTVILITQAGSFTPYYHKSQYHSFVGRGYKREI